MTYRNIIAHRGNAGEYTENTPEALISAFNLDVGGVEIDVHVSSDGVPFIHHDNNLKRIHGVDFEIIYTESKYLNNYCTPLAELVKYISEYGIQTTLFVELKTLSMSAHGQRKIVPVILKILEPIIDRVVIISFDAETLHVVRSINATIRVGLVLITYSELYKAEAEELHAEYLFVDYDKIPPTIREVWEGDWLWVAYEIDSEEKVNRLRQVGIDIYETKQVQKMINLLYPESSTSNTI